MHAIRCVRCRGGEARSWTVEACVRRVVSVWLPNWSTDRLRRSGDAPPPEVPLVMVAHDGRRRVIAAADAASMALGLRPGLPLSHAQARVPGLAVSEADPAGDGAALERLAAWCLRWAPLTAPDPPDGLWLDATGCPHLHGGETALLAALLEGLARQGLAARAAVAGTPGAAHAVARYAAWDEPVAVPPGVEAEALGPLPVAALRVPAETVDGLRRLGLGRVEQLLAAPRAPLARRFGPGLLLRLDQAVGRVPEPIEPRFPPELIQERLAFAEPLLAAEALGATIARLVPAACARLEQAGQGARRLDLLFERVDGLVLAVRVGTSRPTRDARHLGRMLDEQLEQVRRAGAPLDPGLGVEAVRLVVALAEPLALVQAKARAGEGERASADVLALVDRLGPDRVFRMAPVESDVSERAVRAEPAAAGVGTPDLVAAEASWPVSLPRPVRLFRPPQPVQALAALPSYPPAAFTWRRVRHRVRRADGPERIRGEWWLRGGEARTVRDYWAVEDEGGRRYWLFRRGDGADPATGDLGWFLHGLF
jgi:protein ImuB